MTALDQQVSFTIQQAADATGYSRTLIESAVRSGDLRGRKPEVNGRRVNKIVILREDLVAWLRGDAA